MVRNSPGFQFIENVMTAVKTAGLQRALLLAEIEERNMTERNVVQLEITIELKLPPKQLRKPASENAATGDPGRQPAKRTQRFEWRVFRIVNKVTPVAMIDRPAARTGSKGRRPNYSRKPRSIACDWVP